MKQAKKKQNKFDKTSYHLFRQQLGKEIFKIPIPYKEKELALCLSGGIDSSVICAIYSKQRPDLRTYSIGFKEMNEVKQSTEVAKKFKTKHTNMIISKKEYTDACKELTKLKKKYPIQTPSEPLVYLVAKRFKKDIKKKEGVLLLGESGDELFGGYTGILNTIPHARGDLLNNYLDRIVYNKIIWKRLKKKEKEKYKKIFKENDIKGINYDRIQNWLKKLHLPALIQRLRSVNYVKGITLELPFSEPSWVILSEALPKTMRVNKTFFRICFGELLPRETMEQEKIAFELPIDTVKWLEWSLEAYEKGKSNINFWKQ